MGSTGYELATLIDLERVQSLCDSLSAAFDITLAVLDLSGTVLIATGWQDICTRFHREHPDTLSGCLESDLRINQRLIEGLGASDHYAYRCSNGLWDVAFPLVVAGEHIANVYTGQFFFDDDEVDPEAFAERARRLGFDETAYVEALARVPVITHEHLRRTISFLAGFVGILSEMGLSALEREQKHSQLTESEERYRHLFDNATEGLIVFRTEHDAGGGVIDLVVADLNPVQSARTHMPRARIVGRRLSECDGSDERLRAYFEVISGAIAAGRSARCEVCLRTEDAYELLSAYPVGGDLWALSAMDVTELREAERALRRQEEGIRQAYVDVLDAVTGGKLILLTEEQLAADLGEPIGETVRFDSPAELASARRAVLAAAERRFPGRIRHTDLLSTAGEALDNALKHAGGGAYRVYAKGSSLQIAISDEGAGIDFRTLPRAALTPGYSTAAASLGMGFTIMLQLCERVLLTTRPGHTTVVLELAAAREAALRSETAAEPV